MRKRSWVFVGVGFAFVLGGVLFFAIATRGTERPNRGTLGADGVCRAPLDVYCAGNSLASPSTEWSKPCPSYSRALQTAKEREPLLEAEAGTCGELRWVKWSSGFSGETSYFNAKDELVCVETWADYYGDCAGKSATLVYGIRPHCEPVATVSLKQRSAGPVASAQH
jgi:hypothetical protein